MKKIFVLSLFVSFIVNLYSQTEIDAFRLSQKDIKGTARSVGMGGAFGALGADPTGVVINPGGLSVYRSSESAMTFNINNEISNLDNGDNKNARNIDLDNFSTILYFPIDNNFVSNLNIGFNYNSDKSFYKEIYSGWRQSSGNSFADYTTLITNLDNPNPDNLRQSNGDNYEPFQGQNWISVLGFNGGLIKKDRGSNFYSNNISEPKFEEFNKISERGYINHYDVSIATNITNVLNIGASLSFSNLSYESSTLYAENFGNSSLNKGFDLTNENSVIGKGIGFKLGIIYTPLKELRIGLAYHSSTFYDITERYWAGIVSENIIDRNNKYELKSGIYGNSYNFRTPDRLVVSLASVLGNSLIFSMDYELVNNPNMKIDRDYSSQESPDLINNQIRNVSKYSSTLRLGMEYRFNKYFSGRLGYAYSQNPYNDKYIKNIDALVAGSSTMFRKTGDTSYYTGGLGYRLSYNYYIDFAFVYKFQKDDFYSYPNNINQKFIVQPKSLSNTNLSAVFTIGYKF